VIQGIARTPGFIARIDNLLQEIFTPGHQGHSMAFAGKLNGNGCANPA
jgi:hypothetical protein